ncbi:MAG: hypothetical protein JWN40_407 [Phycisphaerales bacterium]|nr:hypothetical protein [Phycisphaerales bacterium]
MHDSSTCPICRTLPAGQALTDDAFDALLAACREELAAKQERFQQRIAGAARWFYEMADGSLTIGDTRFGMTPIGTYSAAQQSWLWAWANEEFPPMAKESAAAVRDLYVVTGLRVFVGPSTPASPADAMSCVAFAVHQLGAIAMFRSPSEDPVLYLAVFEPRVSAA